MITLLFNWIRKKLKQILIGIGVIGIASAAMILPGGCPSDISSALANKTASERASYKAQEIVKCPLVGTYTSLEYGITVKIQSAKYTKADGVPGFEVMARAWKDGVPLGMGVGKKFETERFMLAMQVGGKFDDLTYLVIPDPSGTILVDERVEDTHGNFVTITRKYRYDPVAVMRKILAHTISVSSSPGTAIPGSVGNTTSTFYPDPSVETNSVDGFVGRNNAGSETITTIAAGAGTESADANATDVLLLDSSATTDQFARFRKAIAGFYIAATIPDTDNVDSATFSFMVTATQNGLTGAASANSKMVLSDATPASNTALANGDYTNVGTNDYGRSVQQDTLSTVAYNDITIGAAGLTYLETFLASGTANFGLQYAWGFDGTIVGITWIASDRQSITMVMADTADVTSDPKLVVVHSGGRNRKHLIE